MARGGDLVKHVLDSGGEHCHELILHSKLLLLQRMAQCSISLIGKLQHFGSRFIAPHPLLTDERIDALLLCIRCFMSSWRSTSAGPPL